MLIGLKRVQHFLLFSRGFLLCKCCDGDVVSLRVVDNTDGRVLIDVERSVTYQDNCGCNYTTFDLF